MESPSCVISECSQDDPRWSNFLECLRDVAPEQEEFVLGDYSKSLPCRLILALVDDRVVGFLRFGIQEIGPEFGSPALTLSGRMVTEAKIHAFAVRQEYRRCGIGSALQFHAIVLSRDLGCHQLVSHTSGDNTANVEMKLSLGFAAFPEKDGSVLFLMSLRPAR